MGWVISLFNVQCFCQLKRLNIETKMAINIPAIFEFPGVSITREKQDMGVVKMLRRIRPDWRKEDIILQRFQSSEKGSINISIGRPCQEVVYGGYTSEKSEMVMVKIFLSVSKNQGDYNDESLLQIKVND